jgi:hypothetical protein
MNEDNKIIQLSTPIKISFNGDLKEVEILEVRLPNVSNFKLYADVKSIVMQSILNLENKIKDNATNQNNSEDNLKSFPLELFFTANTIDELSKAINKYLTANGYWDGEIKVNENHLKKLSIIDYNKILSEVSYFLFQI